MRISDRLLVQRADYDLVILDEHTGAEVLIPANHTLLLKSAITYLLDLSGRFAPVGALIAADTAEAIVQAIKAAALDAPALDRFGWADGMADAASIAQDVGRGEAGERP